MSLQNFIFFANINIKVESYCKRNSLHLIFTRLKIMIDPCAFIFLNEKTDKKDTPIEIPTRMVKLEYTTCLIPFVRQYLL